MVATNFGKSGLNLLMSGSIDIPRYSAIGSGSGANVPTLGSLIAETQSNRFSFSFRDITTNQQTTWTFDYGSNTMSGTNLREIGLSSGSTVDANNIWLRAGFPAIEFDGSNELQIDFTLITF